MTSTNHIRGVDDLGKDGILEILELSNHFLEVSNRRIPKVPALRGKTVASLFFEDSTRTRLSFEKAAKRLSASISHELLELVGLEDRYNHKPSELSGGEKQRVAIARALINNPSFILMDEPTGNLDEKSTIKIISLIEQISNDSSSSFVIVTHDMNVAKNMDSIFLLEKKELHKL